MRQQAPDISLFVFDLAPHCGTHLGGAYALELAAWQAKVYRLQPRNEQEDFLTSNNAL